MDGYAGNGAMLCEVRTDGGCVGIAVFNPDIDVHHRAVECSGIGISHTSFGVVASADEPEEVFPFGCFAGHFLETGRVLGKHENRAFAAIADKAYSGGDVNRLAEFVGAFGDEEDAASVFFLLCPVQRFLQGIGYVSTPIRGDGEVLGSEVNGFGIVRTGSQYGCRCVCPAHLPCRKEEQKGETYKE